MIIGGQPSQLHTSVKQKHLKTGSSGGGTDRCNGRRWVIDRKHFLDMKSAAEEERFFSILPKLAAALLAVTRPFPRAAARELAIAV